MGVVSGVERKGKAQDLTPRMFSALRSTNVVTPLIQNQLTAWLLRRTANSGVRRVASLGAALATEVGCIRDENQDRAAIARGKNKQGRNFVVAVVGDGIGGMRDGATCAALALGSFLASIHQESLFGSDYPSDWIRTAVSAANQAVFARYGGDGGSTLVAIIRLDGYPVHWLSIGDSRVYCVTGKRLEQASVDDTIAGQLGKTSDLSFEQSRLLQFVGMGDELEPHIGVFDDVRDSGVLTTDGVHYLTSSPGLLDQIVSHAPDPGTCAKRLVELSKWCGGLDNGTVAIVSLSSAEQNNEEIPFPCFEVWDAFGELQIITPDSTRAPSSNGLDESIGQILPNESAVSTAKDSIVLRQEKKGTESSKRRRSKTSPKKHPQVKSRNKKGGKSEPETPQLLVEFPTKEND